MKITPKYPLIKAFTWMDLLVILATIGLLGAVVLPTVSKPKVRSSRTKCVNNLRNIGLAFRIFATDHNDRYPTGISTNLGGSLEFTDSPNMLLRTYAALSNELSTPRILLCPSDPNLTQATNFDFFTNDTIPNRQKYLALSYFINASTNAEAPDALLAGDRNITNDFPPRRNISKSEVIVFKTNSLAGWTADIHRLQGNVALGDGSVQQRPPQCSRISFANRAFRTTSSTFPERNELNSEDRMTETRKNGQIRRSRSTSRASDFNSAATSWWWRLSRCDNPARVQRAVSSGFGASAPRLRRWSRHHSSQRDEFHLQQLTDAPDFKAAFSGA